jgi:DNA modification methylase
MSRVETIGDATLYLGDCREILPTLPRVDAVVTSPPYAEQRRYEGGLSDWDSLVPPALSAMSDAGQVFVNLGLVHRDGEVIEYWRSLVDAMRAAGWRFFGWYVWDQGPGMPGDWQGRLAPSHEWILHFNKEARKPHKTVLSSFAGYVRRTPQTGIRQADGTHNGWAHGVEPTQERKIPDSVVRIVRHKHQAGMLEAGHPAVFPSKLAEHLAAAYTSEGETVADPFMGSGSTGVACIKLCRKFIGIEIEPKYFDIACRRIEEAWKQPRLFEEPRAKAVQTELELTRD